VFLNATELTHSSGIVIPTVLVFLLVLDPAFDPVAFKIATTTKKRRNK
jgi:hypothetical protein